MTLSSFTQAMVLCIASCTGAVAQADVLVEPFGTASVCGYSTGFNHMPVGQFDRPRVSFGDCRLQITMRSRVTWNIPTGSIVDSVSVSARSMCGTSCARLRVFGSLATPVVKNVTAAPTVPQTLIVTSAEMPGINAVELEALEGIFDDLTVTYQPPPCAANFDGIGGVTAADIFAFLNAWFAGDARGEFDGVAGLTAGDIFAFLNLWFVGCS